jgi:hypothetical protein
MEEINPKKMLKINFISKIYDLCHNEKLNNPTHISKLPTYATLKN